MVRCRFVMSLVLIALWLATPALACLPNPHMTNAEMACCKKMAGDCHMGAGQHPCCKTIASAPQPVASVQSTSQIQPSVMVVAKTAILSAPSIAPAEAMQIDFGLPPPAPPGLHSILRI